MQELDFQQVRGFEPNVSPYTLLDALEEHRYENSTLKLQSQLDYLEELTQTLDQPVQVSPVEENESVSIPFSSLPRQSIRWQFSDEWCAGEIRLLGRTYPCQIVEMSIGGFGIVLPRLQSFQPGTLGHLCAPGLHYIVSVTRIERREEGCFIGLKQIEEIIEDAPYSPGRSNSALGYAIAGVAGALIPVLSYFFMQGH